MAIIITITSQVTSIDNRYTYSYDSDRILKNILTGSYEVFYSGQNQGKLDYVLVDGIRNQTRFELYYRKNNTMPFTYLGSTTTSSIVHERRVSIGENSESSDRLQIRLEFQIDSIKNQEIHTEFEGKFKFKKAVLEHSMIGHQGQNFFKGFYVRHDAML